MPSTTQSIEKLQKKLEKDPNSHLFSQLAEEHRKEGNLEEAIRILKTGLARHPNYWSAHVTLGRVYHQMGNTPSARDELEKVVEAVPDNLMANRLLGDIYTSIQLPGEALKRYRIVQMLTPGDQDLVATIQRLESEVVEEAPAPVEEAEMKLAASEPQAAAVEQEAEANQEDEAEEVFAPTMQMQVPDFLDKTEVTVPSDSYDSSESPVEESFVTDPNMSPIEMMTLPEEILTESEPEEPAGGNEAEQVAEAMSFTPDTLILEPVESFDEQTLLEPERDAFDEPRDSDELSTLATLLLSTEPSSMEDHQFEELEEDKVEEYLIEPPQQDRTQPIQEIDDEEEISEADELTSETLAEIYFKQGMVDKAVKVYERLLLNDPGNPRILQRLKELSPDAIEPDENEPVEQKRELLLVERSGSARDEISMGDSGTRRDQVRQRKISTLENWLTTIRRERD